MYTCIYICLWAAKGWPVCAYVSAPGELELHWDVGVLEEPDLKALRLPVATGWIIWRRVRVTLRLFGALAGQSHFGDTLNAPEPLLEFLRLHPHVFELNEC